MTKIIIFNSILTIICLTIIGIFIGTVGRNSEQDLGAYKYNPFTKALDYFVSNSEMEPDVASGTVDLFHSGQICLTGDCKTSWPSGGGSATFDDNLWFVGTGGQLAYASTTSENGAFQEYIIGDTASATAPFLFNIPNANLKATNVSSTNISTTDLYATNLNENAANLIIGGNVSGTQMTLSELWGINTSQITEGSNLYYTSARFDSAFAGKNTDNLTEGSTNKYWSNSLWDTKFEIEQNSTTLAIPGTWNFTGNTTMGNVSSTQLTATELWGTNLINTGYTSTTGDISATDIWLSNLVASGYVSSTGDISTNTTLYAPQICLNGDCQTAWPTASDIDQYWYSVGAGMYPSTSLPLVYASNTEMDYNSTTDITIADTLWGTTGSPLVIGANASVTTDLSVADNLWVDAGNDAVVISATSTPNNTYTLVAYGSTTEDDIQMFYDSATGSFRGGQRIGTDWSAANLGQSSFAWGGNETYGVKASGDYSAAFGYRNVASGIGSFAAGYANTASGLNSVAMGASNTASNSQSVAIGDYNTASGARAVSIGEYTNVSGSYSVGIGRDNVLSAHNSVVLGRLNTGSGGESLVILGSTNTAAGNYSLTTGYGSIAGDASGDNAAIAMGYQSDALDPYAIAIGYNAQAIAERSIGIGDTAQSLLEYGVAIGTNVSSTAVGAWTLGSGAGDGSPLTNATASSLAVGFNSTTATLTIKDYYVSSTGELSVSEELYASGGLFVSNINSDATLLTIGSNVSTSSDLSVGSSLWIDDSANQIIIAATSTPNNTYTLVAYGSSTNDDIQMFYDSAKGAMRGGQRVGTDWDAANLGEGSFAWGYSNKASNDYSVAMGQGNTASGAYSVALGNGNQTSSDGAVAMGTNSTASGQYSVALGYRAQGNSSGAVGLGYYAEAKSVGSVAIGYRIDVTGSYSFAVGYYSTAGNASGDETAIAMGWVADALDPHAIAIGYIAQALSEDSVAIGTNVSSTAVGAWTLGSGAGDGSPLTNATASSLAVGFNSTTATLTVKDYYASTTGEWSFPEEVYFGGTLYSGGGSPGGSNTQVQYNDSSAFNGDSDFVWNKTTDLLTATNASSTNLSGTELWGTTITADSIVSNVSTTLGELTLPTDNVCEASERGTIGIVKGGTNQGDMLIACLKSAGGKGQWTQTYDAEVGIRTMEKMGNNYFIGLEDGTVWYASSTVAGAEWTLAYSTGDWMATALASTTQGFFIGSRTSTSTGKVYISSDQGESWTADTGGTLALGYPQSIAELGDEGLSEVYFGIYSLVTPPKVYARTVLGSYSSTTFAKGNRSVSGLHLFDNELFAVTTGNGAIYKKSSILGAWNEHWDYSSVAADQGIDINDDGTSMYLVGGNGSTGTLYASSSSVIWHNISGSLNSGYAYFRKVDDFGSDLYIATSGGTNGGDVLKYNLAGWSRDLDSGQPNIFAMLNDGSSLSIGTQGTVGHGYIYHLTVGLEGYYWSIFSPQNLGGMGQSIQQVVQAVNNNWLIALSILGGILIISNIYLLTKLKK